MVCARCGHTSSSDAGRCPKCGAPFTENFVATGVIPIDTTGLPPGGTFGPTTARPAETPADAPAMGDAATIGPAPTIGPATIGPAATIGPGATIGGAATIGDAATIGPTPTMDGAAAAPRQAGPLKVGQSFGPRYHIIKLLGAGGMGAVYQAWDEELGVAVALKVIRTSKRRVSAELEKRFKNELLLARSVTHKNVVRIHDLGEIESTKYITMSYVQGDDLSTLLRRNGKVPIARSLALARQIAAGLEAAHDAGVVHRDLKPANIMIGADDLALIMDFGISASAEQATTGGIVGTLEYMAPEQGTGQAVDGRADIYAFGLILYELLTGPRLVPSATPSVRIEAMKYRTTAGLPSVRAVDPSIPEPLDGLVMRCLERDPAARFQTTAELVAALAALDDAGELIPIARRLTRPMMAAAAAIVMLLLGGTYFATRRLVTPPKTHDPVSVLIANFENRTQDPAFEGSLEQALGIAVEGASFITTYNRDDARKLIAQLKPGAILDESSARLLAMREGITVVLAGSIEPSGSGYAMTIKAVNPTDGKTMATATASASRKGDVLQRVGTAAARIRKELGDTTSDSERLAASETVTAASLEAVREYSRAQDLLYSGKDEEAIVYYKRAIEQDPNLGRAYSGWGISATNLGRQQEAAEAYKKALSLQDRMTEREKYRMLGTYYLQAVQNYDKAIENYSTLVKLYPYDRSGHGNLALAYFYARNFPKALEEGQRSIEGGSRDLLFRNNYALYAMYASDFKAAAEQSRKDIQIDPALMKAYLPLAVAAIAGGDSRAARDAYGRMAKVGASGASLSSLGLADLAMYEGRFSEAEATAKAAIAEDERIRNTAGSAAKYIVLGEAQLAQGKTAPAVDAARHVLKMMGRNPVTVLAAQLLVRTGKDADVKPLAAELSRQLQPENRAYGRIIDGEIALREGRTIDAVEAFLAAQKLTDLWLARLDLGIAYVQAEHFAEGLAELDRCLKRQGEATAIFLDDLPSFRYLAPLPYWLARAQEGVGLKPAATENYKKYLALHASAARDPLAADARKRLAAQ